MALQFQRRGITRIHPLEGGLAGWMALNYPVAPVPVPEIPTLDRTGAERIPPTSS